MKYDHTELYRLVVALLEDCSEKDLTRCIQECHDGRLRRPINQENLHLFRRFRNDPENGSGSAEVLIARAQAALRLLDKAPKFDAYVVPGDSITIQKDGRTYVAHIEFDQDYNIDDDDVHNEDQTVMGFDDKQFAPILAARKAWFNNEWHYVGVVVELVCETCGQTRNDDDNVAALWGIEANYPEGDNDYLTEVANNLIEEIPNNSTEVTS